MEENFAGGRDRIDIGTYSTASKPPPPVFVVVTVVTLGACNNHVIRALEIHGLIEVVHEIRRPMAIVGSHGSFTGEPPPSVFMVVTVDTFNSRDVLSPWTLEM